MCLKTKIFMKYNTQRERLEMSEYGRYVQSMVDYIKTLPDKETRNKAAETVVNTMMTVQQGPKDMNDFKQKLWDHLILLGNFELDIDSPYPLPKKDEKIEPKVIDYKAPYEVRFRFYGRYVEKMVKKAIEMEDGDEKNELVRLIANTMKKLYIIWNKDSVKDEIILEQLDILSDGKLSLQEGITLQDTTDFVKNNKQKQWNQQNKKSKRSRFRKK